MVVKNNNYSLQVCNNIQEICQPLFDSTLINAFEYSKSFANGGFTFFCNNPLWVENYFQKEYYKMPEIGDPEPNNKQEKLLLTSILMAGTPIVSDAEKNFGVAHVATLSIPVNDGIENYFFAAAPEDKAVLHYYINHTDQLKQFVYYFRDKAHSLIETHEKHKHRYPQTKGSLNNINDIRGDINDTHQFITETKRYYLSKNIYLTQTEIRCLRWLAQGKSLEEIGVILQNSNRTIESHLNNIKKKLNCYKTAHLLLVAKEMGLI